VVGDGREGARQTDWRSPPRHPALSGSLYGQSACPFFLKAVRSPSNKKRHETLQRFMLLNDSATIATEIPLYLMPEDFAVFAAQGFTFPFGEKPLTGHIDLVQLRASYLHILDYKPEARKEKHVVTQLTIYALALSQRTGVPVKAFKCAWFDEKDYFEFFPLPAVYPKKGGRHS
jgi:ATP-dependent exoDNAse (exonuclease V) beta subunit